MMDRQILDVEGDWKVNRGNLRPGGWAFQYRNDHYPDVDDTAVVAMALHRTGDPIYREAIERATEWIIGMQSKNGGWGAFDADNQHYFLDRRRDGALRQHARPVGLR
jgi:squalene-hopene/tetraprenyl-beta-curcumene cyclase